jgi:hypothetical protein
VLGYIARVMEMSYRQITKIIGWTGGMALAVFMIMDGKVESKHPWEHALIGAGIGLILGIIFALRLKEQT